LVQSPVLKKEKKREERGEERGGKGRGEKKWRGKARGGERYQVHVCPSLSKYTTGQIKSDEIHK
jgi:hypothetical protein